MSNKQVNDLIAFLNKEFPFKQSEEWDKVGHMNGDATKSLQSVVVALDLTTDVMQEAIKAKADTIIVHHPFIFGDDLQEEFKQYPYKKPIYDWLQKSKVNLIVLHTNFDISKNGMTKTIGDILGTPIKTASRYGLMIKSKYTLEELKNIFATQLKSPMQIMYLPQEKSTYNKIGILPGAGDMQDILAMHKDGAELVITSDIKWSTWQLAKEMNINLIQVPHSIEQVFIINISKLISMQFSESNIAESYPDIF